jgi:hypothetical protein
MMQCNAMARVWHGTTWHGRVVGARRCSQGCNKCALWYCEDDERRCVAAGRGAIEDFVTMHPHLAAEARALTHVGPYAIR